MILDKGLYNRLLDVMLADIAKENKPVNVVIEIGR